MTKMIRGLKFTVKGGKGSGHHGHTGGEGGEGKPGGSKPSGGGAVLAARVQAGAPLTKKQQAVWDKMSLAAKKGSLPNLTEVKKASQDKPGKTDASSVPIQGASKEEEVAVRTILEQLPQDHLGCIESISIEDNVVLHGDFEVMGICTHKGTIRLSRKALEDPGLQSNATKETILHEIGHAVMGKMQDTKNLSLGRVSRKDFLSKVDQAHRAHRKLDQTAISRYAKTNNEEFFAEAYAKYSGHGKLNVRFASMDMETKLGWDFYDFMTDLYGGE